ncbi:hypothetical protein HOI71_19900, partial [Candidatus Poribacteria bacterium]|nr:hypothetical protein [Candidatus Poribacteria bacterium]
MKMRVLRRCLVAVLLLTLAGCEACNPTFTFTYSVVDADGNRTDVEIPEANVHISIGETSPVEVRKVVSSGGSITLDRPGAGASFVTITAKAEEYPEVIKQVPYASEKLKYDVHIEFSTVPVHTVRLRFWHVHPDTQRQIGTLDGVRVELPAGFTKRVFTLNHRGFLTFPPPADLTQPIRLTVSKPGYEVQGEMPELVLAKYSTTTTTHALEVKFVYEERTYALPISAHAGSAPVRGVTVTAKAKGSPLASATTGADGAGAIQVRGRRGQALELSADHGLFSLEPPTKIDELPEPLLLPPLAIVVSATTLHLQIKTPASTPADERVVVAVFLRRNGVDTKLAAPPLMSASGARDIPIPTPETGQVVVTVTPANQADTLLAGTEVIVPVGSNSDIDAVVELQEAPPVTVSITVDAGTQTVSGLVVKASGVPLQAVGGGVYRSEIHAIESVSISAEGEGLVFTSDGARPLPLTLPIGGQPSVSGTIHARWEPVTFRFKVVATVPGGPSGPLSGVSVSAQNLDGPSSQAATTDSSGVATIRLDADADDRIRYSLSTDAAGITGGGTDEQNTSSLRAYDVDWSFQRLCKLNLALRDARTGVAVRGATAHAGDSLFAQAGDDGVVSEYVPAGAALNLTLQAPGHLSEDYQPTVPNRMEFNDTRFMIDIRPPRHTAAIADVFFDEERIPIDSLIHGAEKLLGARVRSALKAGIDSAQRIDLVDTPVEGNPTVANWLQGATTQWVVLPTMRDPTGEEMRLSVEVYEVETGTLLASAEASVTPTSIGTVMLNQILSRLVQMLPVSGYAVSSRAGSATINIGGRAGVRRGHKFRIFPAARAPNGKVVDPPSNRTGPVEGEVVSAPADSAEIRLPNGVTIARGSLLERVPPNGALRVVVVGILPNRMGNTVTVEWAAESSDTWQVGGRGQV